jgi:hypothetical protein
MDPSASAGSTKLGIGMPYGLMARNATLMKGGKRRSNRKQRKQRKQTRRQRKQRGGFLPSIGEGFVAAAAKYAAPLALLGLYKLMNKPTRKRSRSTRRK